MRNSPYSPYSLVFILQIPIPSRVVTMDTNCGKWVIIRGPYFSGVEKALACHLRDGPVGALLAIH